MHNGTPVTTSIDIRALKKSVSQDPLIIKNILESKLKAFFKPSEKGFVVLHNSHKYCMEVSREKIDYREKKTNRHHRSSVYTTDKEAADQRC